MSTEYTVGGNSITKAIGRQERIMRLSDKVMLGAIASLGFGWGGRQVLRASRRISLDNRVVVITGASSGHGLIAARYAAQHGAHIILAARHTEELYTAEIELARASARDVLAVPTDVTDREQCQYLIDLVIDRFGKVDILVNNAGTILVSPLEHITLEDFETSMATNFWGALHCIDAVLPHMRARKFGRIANVSSIGGKVAVPYLASYVASKFALTGLTKSLRTELAKDGILVTGVYPGTMRTGGHPHAWVKGDLRATYALFGLSDTLPLVSVSAERVAHAMWRAVLDGDADVEIGWAARLAALAQALAPNWTAEGLSLLARTLPAPGQSHPAVQGQDIHGTLADQLNQQIPRDARPHIGVS